MHIYLLEIKMKTPIKKVIYCRRMHKQYVTQK